MGYIDKQKDGNAQVCPICGNRVSADELFCSKCGMRIHAHALKVSSVSQSTEGGSKEQVFRNFREWCDYWAELYVENHDFWVYLISEHIDDPDFELPLLVCAHEFRSLKDMQDAYVYLCQNEKDFGYGLASDSVVLCEDEKRWYVFLDCSDLPFVLLVADYFHGKICGWADYFIQMPPMPITLEKSLSIAFYKGNFAPVRAKRKVMQIKEIAQKHQQSNLLKPISDLKANLRSIYVFLREQDYEDFKNKVWYENRDIYNKLDWYGSSGAYRYEKCWVVKLYDDLTAVELEWTVDRIREFHGQYYQP